MGSTLISGGYVITGVNEKDEVSLVEDGAVYQENGRIVETGKRADLAAKYQPDETVGSPDHIVMPGLVDAHHATALSSNLMGNPDDSLEMWLLPMMGYRAVDPYLVNLYTIAQLYEGGVTAVMHLHFPRNPGYAPGVMKTVKAYADGGIRLAFAPGARDQNHIVYGDDGEFLKTLPKPLAQKMPAYLGGLKVSEAEYFEVLDELFRSYPAGEPARISILVGVAGPQWCSDRLLRRLKETAAGRHTGIHAHMLETVHQKMYPHRVFGQTFPEHLDELGFLGPEVSFAHSVWATGRDIERYAANGVSVCHNPSSNLRLAGGIAPVRVMLDKGVNVALGMDGHALSDRDDMLEDMRLCANLQRLPGAARPGLTPGELVRMATVNGARAALLGDTGSLEPGKRADIILVNFKGFTEPYIDPEAGIVDVLLARGRGTDVETVMVDGEIVYRDRKHLKINKADIAGRIRESLGRALGVRETELRALSRELRPFVEGFYRGWTMPDLDPFYKYNSR